MCSRTTRSGRLLPSFALCTRVTRTKSTGSRPLLAPLSWCSEASYNMEEDVMRIQTLYLSVLIWGVLATVVGAIDERSMDQISQEEVRAAVRTIVEQRMQANGGVFVFRDSRAGEDLQLAFED